MFSGVLPQVSGKSAQVRVSQCAARGVRRGETTRGRRETRQGDPGPAARALGRSAALEL